MWGYHPLGVSLANTAEPLFLANRSGNRPSHEQADGYLDRAIALCRRGGLRRGTLRGDTDLTRTGHLDRWDADGARFRLGIDARRNLKGRAEDHPAGGHQRAEASGSASSPDQTSETPQGLQDADRGGPKV